MMTHVYGSLELLFRTSLKLFGQRGSWRWSGIPSDRFYYVIQDDENPLKFHVRLIDFDFSV